MADTIINTFEKGLHQDSTFTLQPDGTYRNLKNGMLISHDGNHFVLELSKGNKVLFTLPSRYHANNSVYTTKDTVPMPIGFISFIDKLVVFSTNNESASGGYGEIGVVEFTKVSNDFVATYTPYYHHPSLNFTKYHKIEGFASRENDKIERVYWSDNLNEPRVFDIADPKFTTYFTGTADLTVGKQYMVVEGVIQHTITAVNYYFGPSDDANPVLQAIPFVNGNIFTADNTSFTVISGTAKVIEYYPIELLDWTPSRMLGNIDFHSYGGGTVRCGNKIYYYRLSDPANGIQTTWSYGSNPIPVEKNFASSSYVPGTNDYHNYSGAGTSSTLVDSGFSVKVRIQNIDTNFKVIELACAEFDQSNDTPYSITIVQKFGITGEDMVIEHNGSTNYGTLTLNDITLFPASILRLKTLTTDKNYILIANTTEREEFTDTITATLGSVVYPLIAHGDPGACGNSFTYDMLNPVVGVNPTFIEPWSRYLVTDDNNGADPVVYDALAYYQGQVFVGVAGVTAVTIPAGAECRPCTTLCRYINQSTSARVENAIELKTGFWDYKDPAVASHNRGYWSNDKYRIAVVFFDLKGNPFYARYLGDYTFPDVSTKGGLIGTATGTEISYHLRPSLLTITNLDIPEAVMNMASGFSIMRAERDARILTQGLVLQTANDSVFIKPISTFSFDDNFQATDAQYLTYSSPDELAIDYAFRKNFRENGDLVEEAFWVGPYYYTPNVRHRAASLTGSAATSTTSKLFTHLAHDTGNSAVRLTKIESVENTIMLPLNENESVANIDASGFTFLNRIQTNTLGGGGGPAVDLNCTVGGTTQYDDYKAVGSRKLVFKVETMFKNYAVANLYSDSGYNGDSKIVMNYVKPINPMDQYGGTSDFAIANTLYMSTGHFQPINDAVKADTSIGGGIYRFSGMEIGGGDCYVNMIDHGLGLFDDAESPLTYSWGVYFPCECNVNFQLRRGTTISKRGMYDGYGAGLAWNNGSGTVLEDYQYNPGYSSEGNYLKYPALPVDFKATGRFEYRARFAGEKQPGEIFDSYRKFLTNDYKDLDGKLGEINNIRSKDGRVIAWQNHGTSSIPVLERQLLSATSGAATTIGTGGVVDRYDPLTSYYGNQHQHGLTDTEYGYIWFDMRRRALCIMGASGDLQEISLIKGLQAFFNNEFNEGDIFLTEGIYNTNNSTIPEIPLLGYGIVGVYDPQFKMSYLTFKYTKDTLVDEDDELVTIEAKDFTIGYCHSLNAIVGFYDFTPAIWHNHNDLVLSSNDAKNRKYYGANMPATIYNIGDTIRITGNVTSSKNGEYVCLKTTPSSSYPLTGIYEPTFGGSIYWVKTNDQSQVYLQYFNTQYLKFYGQVYNVELEIIVNPKVDDAFTPQNIQVKGTGDNPNFTDVYCSTDDQSASDLSIHATSRNYRLIDKAWFSNLPLPRNGRLTDYYTKIKLVFKGYVTNPTVSKNQNKVTQWIKTFFVIKK